MTLVKSTTSCFPTGLVGLAVCAVALGCLTVPGVVRAADSTVPDAAIILDKFIEATGGRLAYEKIHNRVTKGHHEFVEMGFKGTQVLYEAQPNKAYYTLEAEAIGKIQAGSSGDVAWYLSPQTGPLVESGDARAAGLREAAFDRDVNWRKFYKKAEYAGEDMVEGKTCHKIVLTPEVGKPETRYYDTESNLLVKTEKTRLSSIMPPRQVAITVSDYRPVDGVLIAHKRKQVAQGCGGPMEIVFVTDTIEHNVDMPSDRFTPPQAIQALAGNTATVGNSIASGGGCGGSSTTTASSGSGSGGGAAASTGSGCCGGSGDSAKAASASRTGAGCGGGCGGKCGGNCGAGCGGAKTATVQGTSEQPPKSPGGCGSH